TLFVTGRVPAREQPTCELCSSLLTRLPLRRRVHRQRRRAPLKPGGRVMTNFILVSQEKEDFYVNVDQVRVLLPQSKGGGNTIVFDQDHSVNVDDEADRIMRLAK